MKQGFVGGMKSGMRYKNLKIEKLDWRWGLGEGGIQGGGMGGSWDG